MASATMKVEHYRNTGGPHWRPNPENRKDGKWVPKGAVIKATDEELTSFPDKWEPVFDEESISKAMTFPWESDEEGSEIEASADDDEDEDEEDEDEEEEEEEVQPRRRRRSRRK